MSKIKTILLFTFAIIGAVAIVAGVVRGTKSGNLIDEIKSIFSFS